MILDQLTLAFLSGVAIKYYYKASILLHCDLSDELLATSDEDLVNRFRFVDIDIFSLSDWNRDIDSIFACSAMEDAVLIDILDRKVPLFMRHEFANFSSSVKPRIDSNLYYFDVQSGNVSIHEAYTVMEGPLMVKRLGYWDADKKIFHIDERNAQERRSNLTQVHLRNGMIPLKRIAAKWKLNDYYRAMLDHYVEIMHFSWEYVYPKVGLFGAKLPNGTWDGIIGELQTGDADITGVGHSQLPVRFEAIEFVHPISQDVKTLFMRELPGTQVNMWTFVLIFGGQIWALIGATAILGAAVMAVVNGVAFQRAMVSTLGMLVMIPAEVRTHGLAQKGVVLSIWLLAYLIFSHFAADLTTSMTVNKVDPPIFKYEDAAAGKFRLLVFKSSADLLSLKTAIPGSAMHTLYSAKVADNPSALVTSAGQAHAEMLADMNAVYYGSSINHFAGCTRLDLEWNFKIPMGFALPPGSELKEMFNHFTLKMQEVGIMKKLRRELDEKITSSKTLEAVTLGFENLALPVMILGLGIALAVVTAAIEYFLNFLLLRRESHQFGQFKKTLKTNCHAEFRRGK